MACWFDKKRENADESRMLEPLRQLNACIAELNDGSSCRLHASPVAGASRLSAYAAMERIPKRHARYETIVL